jgi:chorismate mutase
MRISSLFDIDESPMVIAGPCSAESEQQVLATAKELAEGGVKIYRAGLWKPRTRPGFFEGVGSDGLPWLTKVREATGMKVMTEVATPEHLTAAIDGGVDAVWIGARTTTNPFAVQEIADTLAKMKPDIAVLIKNPVSPDINLWIGAIERIHRAGVTRIAAIHRGFSNYGAGMYRNPPHWAVPIELKRRYPNLPVIHDPSHTGGDASLIYPLCREAMDLCFDGLMIESHIKPCEAVSDASQQITPTELLRILKLLKPCSNSSESMELRILREKVDSLDDELLMILAERMAVCKEIGLYKKEHNMPVIQKDRYAVLLSDKIQKGEDLGLDSKYLKRLFATVHELSVDLQLKIKS